MYIHILILPTGEDSSLPAEGQAAAPGEEIETTPSPPLKV